MYSSFGSLWATYFLWSEYVKLRCAWLATLFFLPIGQQSSYAEEIKKHSANSPEHTATGEQVFQKVALRLAVLRAAKSGELGPLTDASVPAICYTVSFTRPVVTCETVISGHRG